MKEKRMPRGNLMNHLLLSFVLIVTAFLGTGFGDDAEPGPNVYAPNMKDSDGPVEAFEVQALKNGIQLDIVAEEIPGDMAKPGLGGGSANDPLILPAADAETIISASDAQSLKDGYTIVTYVVEDVGDTAKPGLGGGSANDPLIQHAVSAETPLSASDAQALRKGR